MGFDVVRKMPGLGKRGSEPRIVKAWRESPKGDKLRFSISSDVAGPLGLNVGTRFDLLVGSGQDTGTIAVRFSEAVTARKFTRLTPASTAPLFTIVAKLIGAEPPKRVVRLPYSIKDGMLVIDIRPLMPADAIAAAA